MLYQDIRLFLPGEMPGFFYLVEESVSPLCGEIGNMKC